MALKQPESMDECVYFTRRAIGRGRAVCWVFRENCVKCKKGMMAKPKDPKTGKPKIRANEYVCTECNYSVPKQEYEDSLKANIEYNCPECGHSCDTQVPFKRKKFQGVDSVVFECGKCKAKIPITKKMKGSKEEDVE